MSQVLAPLNGTNESSLRDTVGSLYSQLLPTTVPRETGMSVQTLQNTGEERGPTVAMTQALVGSLSAQLNSTTIPFEDRFVDSFGSLMNGGSMATIDTSDVSTQEQLNDVQLEANVMAAPWDDGSEQTIATYDALFAFKTAPSRMAAGFAVVATPSTINQIQARLKQVETDAALFGVSSLATVRNNRAAPIYDASRGGNARMRQTTQQAIDKRRRIYTTAVSSLILPQMQYPELTSHSTTPAMVDSDELSTLRFFGGSTAQELYEKLNYLGPVTNVFDAESNGHYNECSFGNSRIINERLINFSYHSRGKIHNYFAPRLKKLDSVYFSIRDYSRETLLSVGTMKPMMGMRKRKIVNDRSAYAGAVQSRATSGESFVQIRGWSSSEGDQYLGDSSEVESMKPEAQDRFYCSRERQAAVEYQDFRYNPMTDQLEPISLQEQEGIQEALANVPSLILDAYMAPGVVIPVGTVKSNYVKEITSEAILNGHYDQHAEHLLPHFDIFQNYI